MADTTHSNLSISADAVATKHASYISLVVGTLLMAFKFWGYRVTGSEAVFSDAMESIVNVIAACLAIVVVAISIKPADQDHPYGHGKVEYFSAAFEGGLIAFASLLIIIEATHALIQNHPIKEVGFALAVTLAAGAGNLLLGLYLLFIGKKTHSFALIASGQHVISDFWSSVAIALGLGLVMLTDIWWLDPVVALIVGVGLARTGIQLVRRSVGGLLDQEDRGILEALIKTIQKTQSSGIIHLHHTRVMRSGRYHHIDAHAVVPEFWNVIEAHERTEEFEARLIEAYPFDGELHLHVDPCRKAYCRSCDLASCPVRLEPFVALRPITIEELTDPEEPEEYRERTLGSATQI